MLQEYIIVRKFTDIYNKEKVYEIGERVFITEERASEMNIGKTRTVRVLDDEYSEIIRKIRDNNENTLGSEDTPEDENTPGSEDTPEDENTPKSSKNTKKRGK